MGCQADRQTDTHTQIIKDKTATCSLRPISGWVFVTCIKPLSWWLSWDTRVHGLKPWRTFWLWVIFHILTPRSPRILPPVAPSPLKNTKTCTPPPDTKRTLPYLISWCVESVRMSQTLIWWIQICWLWLCKPQITTSSTCPFKNQPTNKQTQEKTLLKLGTITF